MGKAHNERRKICLLKDEIRKQFEEKVTELVDIGVPNLWGHFKDEVVMMCVGSRGKENVKKIHGNAMSRMKNAHKAVCINSTEENKSRYKNMRSKAVKAASKAIFKKSEQSITELKKCKN